MADTPLLRYELLSTGAFVRDFRSLLSLSADVLLAISKLADGPDGFTGHRQARDLSSRFGIQVGKIMRALRFAEYLYDRVAELDMPVSEAADEICLVASELEDPVSIDDQKRVAFQSLLSFKREYEVSNAMKSGATTNAPHFLQMSGAWTIKPIRVRTEEPIMSPVLTMSIVWYDGSGSPHEAFFQMSDNDWTQFTEEAQSLAKSRRDIEPLLK